MSLNFDLNFIDSCPLSGPSSAIVLGILNNVYNQIKINKNGNDCKLVAENVRKIEISIWWRNCQMGRGVGGCRRTVHHSQCTNWWQLEWGSISIGKRRERVKGGWVKLTVDCLGSQTDQKLNSCLTFHSKNWILHLAKKFAVRRISSSSSSSSRRKFFSFTTNLSNFRDLRCTFCSSRSSPRVLALSAWLHPVLQPPPPANKTKAQRFLIMGVTSTITTTKRHCHRQSHSPIQTYRYRYCRMQKQIHLSIC